MLQARLPPLENPSDFLMVADGKMPASVLASPLRKVAAGEVRPVGRFFVKVFVTSVRATIFCHKVKVVLRPTLNLLRIPYESHYIILS